MNPEANQDALNTGHPFSMRAGRWGVVPYATDSFPRAGWVLPGGERTQDAARALAVAQAIDAASRERWGN